MEITITYKNSAQIGPDDWDVYTSVVILTGDETLKEVHEIIQARGFKKDFDGEIHFKIFNN